MGYQIASDDALSSVLSDAVYFFRSPNSFFEVMTELGHGKGIFLMYTAVMILFPRDP